MKFYKCGHCEHDAHWAPGTMGGLCPDCHAPEAPPDYRTDGLLILETIILYIITIPFWVIGWLYHLFKLNESGGGENDAL